MNKKPLLTKLQRYTAYCIMLWEAENNLEEWKYSGICYMTTTIIVGNIFYGSVYDTYNNFKTLWPELFIKGKRGTSYPSFNNWGQRIAALKQCIKETHP